MLIGIFSDTHNHLPETRQALDLLLRHGARHLIHCGDVGADVLDLLAAACLEHDLRSHVAIGNCDHGRQGDSRFLPRPAGIELGDVLEFELAGRRCAVLHGHDARKLDAVIVSGRVDYVFTGHTHTRMDEQAGPTRILNPGSCARPRGGPASVLLLDLATGRSEWLALAGRK